MKSRIILIIINFFFILVCINAQPKIEFEGGNTYDWGTVRPKDSPLKAKIKIWNKGSDTLVIKDVKPGCGCTTAPLDKKIVPPSDFATLDVTINVEGNSGPVNKDIKIISNTQNAIEYLFLNANVFRDITTIDESYFSFADIVLGKDYTREVRIKNNTQQDIKISKIEDKPDYCKLNVQVGTIIPANQELAIKATINMTNLGPFSFSLKIQSEASTTPDLYISAWGNVKE